MEMVPKFWGFCLVIVLVTNGYVRGKPTVPLSDLMSEIQRALEGEQDASYVRDYLNRSEKELLRDLPRGDGDGYTFFAPSNSAISYSRPADVLDPYYNDEFRLKALLNHFTHRVVKNSDFVDGLNVTMVNNSTVQLNQSSDGTLRVDHADVVRVIPLETKGIVYIINVAFVSDEDVYKVISNTPQKYNPWGIPFDEVEGPVDLLSEIREALADDEDVSYILGYLTDSEDLLRRDLPSGNDQSYTFFAPTDLAVLSSLPQDVANPLAFDSAFRRKFLLSHFVRGSLPLSQFSAQQRINMATDDAFVLVRKSDDKVYLNESTILRTITLESMGEVHIIDAFLGDFQEEMSQLLEKYAEETQKFGPLGLPISKLLLEIEHALKDRKDTLHILEYISMSYPELNDDFPSVNGTNGEEQAVTFFAPNDGAILSSLIQDAPDPFQSNDQFRHSALLAHFTRQQLSRSQLSQRSTLMMANNKTATIIYSNDGEIRINGTAILETIPLKSMGTIYLIDGLIIHPQDIGNALGSVDIEPWGFQWGSKEEQEEVIDLAQIKDPSPPRVSYSSSSSSFSQRP